MLKVFGSVIVFLLILVCALLTQLRVVETEYCSVLLAFFGSFHPAALHLPIGLWFGVLCILIARTKRWTPDVSNWLSCTAVLTFFSGVLAFGFGLMLYLSGTHDPEMVRLHLFGALSFIASSGLFTILAFSGVKFSVLWCVAIATSISLVTVGHTGGVLTHGNPMRKAPWVVLNERKNTSLETSTPENMMKKVRVPSVFEEVVLQILQEKCVFCHGAQRTRGRLNLTALETILSGGKSGPAVTEGCPDASLLINRIRLPLSHEKHMPPEGEPQIEPVELALLEWWIETVLPSPDQPASPRQTDIQ